MNGLNLYGMFELPSRSIYVYNTYILINYSRFVDNSRAKKVAHIIYNSMTIESPSTTTISAQLLNTALLRSANFYEAQCFKSIVYADVILQNQNIHCSIV